MIDVKYAPYGALVLRLAMGLLFILHGVYLKVFVYTMDGSAQYFASLGLPAWFVWIVMIYETVGGILLILGIQTRWVSILLGIHLLFAALLGHSANGWLFTNPNGGWEYPVFWAVACFVQALLGDGAHAVQVGGAAKSAT